jgi:hypothetical protein
MHATGKGEREVDVWSCGLAVVHLALHSLLHMWIGKVRVGRYYIGLSKANRRRVIRGFAAQGHHILNAGRVLELVGLCSPEALRPYLIGRWEIWNK